MCASSWRNARETRREFCPVCGSPLFTRYPTKVYIRAGTLDNSVSLKPTRRSGPRWLCRGLGHLKASRAIPRVVRRRNMLRREKVPMEVLAHSPVHIVERRPSVEEFLQLRADAGWRLPPEEVVREALQRTVYRFAQRRATVRQ